MTEPVVYLHEYSNGEIVYSKSIVSAAHKTTPLYTAEQLHPRVKMTQTQYKEWQQVINSIYPVNLYELFNLIFNAEEHHGEYAGMRDIFSFNEGQKKLAQLWADYDPDHPEETIEIAPDMKWFVRSKEKQNNNKYTYLEVGNYKTPDYDQPKLKFATQFDTKEQAELWTNPLTEAVQLPVEGE